MNKRLLLARQLHRAIQLLSDRNLLTEEEMLEIPDMYEQWQTGKRYSVGRIVKHGANPLGETQLYAVTLDHISQEDWTPDSASSLFRPIGFSDDGTPIWTQPYSYDDAYSIGDVVVHNGTRWECTEGNAPGSGGQRNTFEPGVWGWAEII